MFVFCSAPLHFCFLSSVSGHRVLPRARGGCAMFRSSTHPHILADDSAGPSALFLLIAGLHMPVSTAVDSPLEVGGGLSCVPR